MRSRHIGWSGEPPLQFVDELLQNFAESIDPLCSDWCDTEMGVTHPFGSDPITLVFGVGGTACRCRRLFSAVNLSFSGLTLLSTALGSELTSS